MSTYQLIRVLHQLAHDEEEKFLLAAKVTKFNMYVDDVLAGADSIEEARDMLKQVDGMLMAGSFHLQKWVSNEDSILNGIKAPRQLHHPKTFDGDLLQPALGLKRSHQSEALIFTFHKDVFAKGPATTVFVSLPDSEARAVLTQYCVHCTRMSSW